MADNNNSQGPAEGKRRKISKAQQYTMLEVLGASLVLGTCIVMSIFMIKYIKFNTTIITEKNNAIAAYDKTIRNVGVCVDTDKNGRLSTEELENCKPNEVSLNQITNSLRYKVLSQMAQNADLESVARKRNTNCYDEMGVRIDFNKLYEESTDEKEKQQYLQSSKICSALRVIPDALPAVKNTEALMASLNEIFLRAGWEPERLSPRDDNVKSDIEGVDVIPVSLRIEGSDDVVLAVLDRIEHSIREFDITIATVEWSAGGLNLQASANAYYLSEQPSIETTKVLYASRKAQSNNRKSKVNSANSAKDELLQEDK